MSRYHRLIGTGVAKRSANNAECIVCIVMPVMPFAIFLGPGRRHLQWFDLRRGFSQSRHAERSACTM